MTTLISIDPLVTGAEKPVVGGKNAVGGTGRVSKSLYQVAQQVKLLHLQVEVECLWQQLQAIEQQRQTSQETVSPTG
jgi:shikimate kinase